MSSDWGSGGSGVASGVRGARETACAWAGIAWTTMLLTIKLGACLGLAGTFCKTLQISCASSYVYDMGTMKVNLRLCRRSDEPSS
jgi:hypothetical protein